MAEALRSCSSQPPASCCSPPAGTPPSEPSRDASEAIATAEVVSGEYIIVFVADLRDPLQKADELIASMPGS